MGSFIAPLAIAGLSGLGGIFANKPKTTTTNSTQNSAGDQTQTGFSRPAYDPLTEMLRQQLINAYGGSLTEDPDLSGYEASGLGKINQIGDARTAALKNSLASRGLSYSPVAPIATSNSDSQRFSDSASFENSLPLLRRQLMDQRLGAAGSFFKGLPIGQDTYGAGTFHQGQQGHTEQIGGGNELGGGLSSFATTLAGLYGNGAFGGGKKK